ncbi:MAG: NPCBM/NEW2 domain-containing protein [Thermoguttaceae bacterium]
MMQFLLALFLASAAAPFEAQTLDGRTLSGSLAELSATRLAIVTSDGRVSLDTSKLLTLSQKRDGRRPRPSASVVIELSDGSLLRAVEYTVQGGKVRIKLTDGEVVESPINAVRTVQFQPSAELDAEWSRLLDGKADGDLLVIRSEGSLDTQRGVLQDVTADSVRFDLDGEVLPVRRSKVYGLVYRHSAAAELPAAICRLTDAAGSRWAVRSLQLGSGRQASAAGKLQWTTPTGLTVSEPLASVAEIDFSGGKQVYLSDLKPESTTWTPFFAAGDPLPALKRLYGPRFDRGFDAAGLVLGGERYDKGVAVHAHTNLVYRLPAGFHRFAAIAGLDEAARPGGKVRLRLSGDDQVLWEGEITGADAPKAIDLGVAGIRRLTIDVDFVGNSPTGARLLLCKARIVK